MARVLREKVETAKSRIQSLSFQRDQLISAVQRIGKPQGAWGTLAILAYMTVSGVALPLAYLATPSLRITQTTAFILLGTFFSGLVLLFVQMIAHLLNVDDDDFLELLRDSNENDDKFADHPYGERVEHGA